MQVDHFKHLLTRLEAKTLGAPLPEVFRLPAEAEDDECETLLGDAAPTGDDDARA